MRAYMAGCRADCYGDLVLFEPGSFAIAGSDEVVSVGDVIVDIGKVGVNACDRGGLWAEGQAMYFYYIRNTGGQIAGLASPSFDSTSFGGVIVPAGWIMLRKHPFMMCFRTTWGRVQPFHFTGIQNPRIDLMPFATSGRFQLPVNLGPANAPIVINLNSHVPVAGGARVAHLRYGLYPVNGGAGTVFLSADGNVYNELGAANANFGGAMWGDTDVRITSDGYIYYYRNTLGVVPAFYLRGYTVTEVTN